jgi:hypothetical protein
VGKGPVQGPQQHGDQVRTWSLGTIHHSTELCPQVTGPLSPESAVAEEEWSCIPERLARVTAVVAWQYCCRSAPRGWSLGTWLGLAA